MSSIDLRSSCDIPDEGASYVYVIGQRDRWGNEILPLKIGISNNPWYRLFGFQSGCPVKLYILALYKFSSRDEAARIEREFHEGLKGSDHQSHGEWIGLSLERIDEYLQDYILSNGFHHQEP